MIDRELRIEVAHNVRHIAGYRIRDGGVTAATVYRAASLHRLTESGISALAKADISAVFDLRSAGEREKQPTPSLEGAGISMHSGEVFRTDASPAGVATEFAGFPTIYRGMLDTGADAYRQLFQVIIDTDGAVLFHCAAGKDRTGIAAALLLDLAGVSESDIITDYSLSERLLAPMYGQFLPDMQERGLSEAHALALMGAKEEDMAETLAYIYGRWGSAEGYMSSIGLDADAIAKLRGRLAEPRS